MRTVITGFAYNTIEPQLLLNVFFRPCNEHPAVIVGIGRSRIVVTESEARQKRLYFAVIKAYSLDTIQSLRHQIRIFGKGYSTIYETEKRRH